MVTYGTSVIPSDEITVESGNTVSISLGFNATVGVVGSYDSANGSATAGEVTEVGSTRDARNKFGDGSELHRAIEQIYANGAVTVFAVPLPSTETTESGLSGSGTLNEFPIFDPRVTSHDITVQDTTDASAENVVISYEDTLTTADSGDFKVNPITGDYQDDGDANSYDVTYDYGTDTEWTDAIAAVAKKDIRVLNALTEEEGRINDAGNEAGTRADDFDFFGVVAGATPERSPGSYSDNLDDRRVSVVAPARAYAGTGETEEFRLSATVAGKVAGKQLGDSTTYENVDNVISLNTEYTNSELGTWIDNKVTPVKQGNNIKIIKDMTTSEDQRFERIYAREIVDEATEASHLISQEYLGDLNTNANRRSLGDQHSNFYEGMIENTPRLLDAYDVSVSENDTNENAVDVTIGLDVVDVIDRVNVDISVGDVITATQG